jgi:hypothetical protein
VQRVATKHRGYDHWTSRILRARDVPVTENTHDLMITVRRRILRTEPPKRVSIAAPEDCAQQQLRRRVPDKMARVLGDEVTLDIDFVDSIERPGEEGCKLLFLNAPAARPYDAGVSLNV